MGRTTRSEQPGYSASAATLRAAFLHALQAAREFEGATSPNPPVGCVLLDEKGNELAVAAHRKAGGLHAEALAIEMCRQARLLDRIHTVIVTLEPCNHTGRTPPCTNAILATPARQVWIGTPDPNNEVLGGGAERLAAEGLAVHFVRDLGHAGAEELEASCNRLIAPFAKRLRTGLPWITVKQALDTSGSMIPPTGRKTFTSPSSLALAHRMRRRADAILTGSGTVLADEPEFTVRLVSDFPSRSRELVILDRRGRVSQSYLAAARQRGLKPVVEASLKAALTRLSANGALEVLLEAGPTLTQEVLGSGIWDEHVVITKGRDQEEDRISVRYRFPLSAKD
jgi:diaminohydroxyphosphoribosylaminopyrimidine deaminase/5-amino-6-(5-phosphoribosylamino)uracil reductase